jgi:alginate O-acetyltransferase complex protein AlgI
MLFCSAPFFVFYCAVFAVYWAMPSRWMRAGLGLIAGLYLGEAAWSSLQAVSAASVPDFTAAAAAFFSGLGGAAWMAGIILVATGLAYRIGPDRARVWLLLAASFFFYASWNKWLALLICVSTALDYLIALRLDAGGSQRQRRLLVTCSLVANLGLLCYFKYANFFIESLEEALNSIGASASIPLLDVLLPVGISFYTFEAINYTVDVYRRRLPAERSLANFILFITFFPHLIAGPIVRARDFLPQIRRTKHWDWARLHLGMQYFIMGMFKKLAIADRMALFADPVFTDPGTHNTGALWLATLAYALQVYCDFSGYTDMALGCAHMLGYKLAQNFNMPYLSANISEFWRRWHISLSSWLRDYLFIPLGGSRAGRWLTYRNLLLTMALGGLWHGAAWNFVIFGVIQGFMLSIHRAFREFCESRPRLHCLLQSRPGTVLRVAFTFVTFSCSLVVFRCTTLLAGMTMLHRMVVPCPGMGTPLHNRSLWCLVGVVALAHALAQRNLWKKIVDRLPSPVRGFGYAAVLTLAMVLAPEAEKAFIYFQF